MDCDVWCSGGGGDVLTMYDDEGRMNGWVWDTVYVGGI